jgi:hypothetical protein
MRVLKCKWFVFVNVWLFIFEHVQFETVNKIFTGISIFFIAICYRICRHNAVNFTQIYFQFGCALLRFLIIYLLRFKNLNVKIPNLRTRLYLNIFQKSKKIFRIKVHYNRSFNFETFRTSDHDQHESFRPSNKNGHETLRNGQKQMVKKWWTVRNVGRLGTFELEALE